MVIVFVLMVEKILTGHSFPIKKQYHAKEVGGLLISIENLTTEYYIHDSFEMPVFNNNRLSQNKSAT